MSISTIDTTHVPWQRAEKYPPGTQYKVLRRNERGEPLAVILQLPPGFSIERHSHVVDEHHFVLDGKVQSEGESLGRGSYQLIPAHADHGPYSSLRGAEVLVIWTD